MMLKFQVAFFVLLFSAGSVWGQGSVADYKRMEGLGRLTSGKVFRDQVNPLWLAEGNQLWYRVRTGKDAHEYVFVDLTSKTRTLAFDHEKVAKQLSEVSDKPVGSSNLPLAKIKFSADLNTIYFEFQGESWTVNRKDSSISKIEKSKIPDDADQGEATPDSPRGNRGRQGRRQSGASADSPDKSHRVTIKDNKLLLVDSETKVEAELGLIAEKGDYFSNRNFFWSPDSRYVVAFQVTPGDERKVFMIESSPDKQLQPKLHEMTYPKPGDKIRTERPRIFDVTAKKEVEVDDALFKTPWRISGYRWRADSSEFSFLYNQRGHQIMRLVGVNPSMSTVRSVIEETPETFVDYTNKTYAHYLEEKDEIVWMSEESGWNHLYLYDWNKGEVKNPITTGNWVVRGVDRIDEEARQIWFRASGLKPEQDPYLIHHCRVNFDGSNLVILTEGNGTHSIRYSPNKEYLVDTWSRVDLAPVTEIRRVSDGALVCHLERADTTSLLETGWNPTVPFSAKGRDGETDIFGVIYFPTNFDASGNSKLPVIEYIYAGPHDSFVPKRFRTHNQARAMAELGFIVVQIDGMGTNNRGKAFHDVCWKNLGDSGFPDRILWLQAAAQKFPQMDLSRVGIYGGSAGGQSALRALLAHGDFYQVAVSDCGCHDNRMDKVWWNEQWMGWPIGPHYEEQSNVTNAHKLTGKLFLIVGELDRNVDPASTMQVVNALIKADKDFDFVVVPGAGHGIGSGRYGMRRTRDFFVRHLHGVEPRSE